MKNKGVKLRLHWLETCQNVRYWTNCVTEPFLNQESVVNFTDSFRVWFIYHSLTADRDSAAAHNFAVQSIERVWLADSRLLFQQRERIIGSHER